MSYLRLYSLLLGGVSAVAVSAFYWVRTHRKTPEQLEMQRRLYIAGSGRITDGTVLEVQEFNGNGRGPSQFLSYTYDVAGVCYECSQEITSLRQYVNLQTCHFGRPASVKYDPHNPANSIVVAENWIGLRR
jgi:hypothetical protein